MSEYLNLSRQHQPHTVRLRREIHEHPELGDDLHRTKAAVVCALQPLGLEMVESPTTSSFVARMQTGRPGKTLILRADMDALPMDEETGLDFASKVPGRMHSCGHDCHTAMLTSAACILHGLRDQLAGEVRFVFEADEEGDGGARVMMDEGLLDNGGSADAAFALHIMPTLKSGVVESRPGPIMSAADSFRFTLTGAGGHGSAPHQANDPIPVACEMIMALQVMVTRKFSTFEPVVISVGSIHAGTVSNIIPDQVVFEATVRTCTEDARDRVDHLIRKISTQLAEAHDMALKITRTQGSGATINSSDFVDMLKDVVTDMTGPDGYVTKPEPYMAAEDFSSIVEKYGGAFAMLGVAPRDADPASAAPLHSPRMMVDEDALAIGVATHVAVASRFLAPR
ncbi:M20 metallopeptidase family protein [Roseovarius sp. 2305UL8-3]|uniref:M20 metallopeptidase family protein n=1 Tax=Roseovarius conchicola TaxID=3121636 RepID=UPI003528086F